MTRSDLIHTQMTRPSHAASASVLFVSPPSTFSPFLLLPSPHRPRPHSSKTLTSAAPPRPPPRSFTMVRAYKQDHVYHHPWDRVTTAAWRKFTDPDTPAVLSHVVDVHTLNRRLDPASGRLHAVRSITVRSPPLPFLLRRILGQEAVVCQCVESTVVDARERSMEIVIRNASLRGLIEVEERSTYRPHPERPEGWTAFRQETSIRCKPLSVLAAVAEKVEQRCADRFQQNSAKGREFVERICKYLEAEASAAASTISC